MKNQIPCDDLFVLSKYYREICDNYIAKSKADKLWEETKDLEKLDSLCEKMSNQLTSEKLLKKSNINKRFLNRNFNNYKTFDHITTRAKLVAKEYAENIYTHLSSGTNLVIEGLGDVGTGKTHLACSIAHAAIEQGIPTKFINVVSIISELEEQPNIPQFVKTYANIDLLIIDDFGKEDNLEFVSRIVYQIINIRYEREIPTIITTEGAMSTMTAHYKEKGKAIQSRIAENYILITLTGEDYRQKQLFDV